MVLEGLQKAVGDKRNVRKGHRSSKFREGKGSREREARVSFCVCLCLRIFIYDGQA